MTRAPALGRLALGFATLLVAGACLGQGTPADPSKPSPRDLTAPMLGPYVRPPPGAPTEEEDRPGYELLERPGPYHHGGFYLRLAGGLGLLSDSGESGDDFTVEGEPRQSLSLGPSGFAYATEVAMGLTLFSGWVLGAGIYTATSPSPSGTPDAGSTGKFDFDITQLIVIGPMIDVYPSPTSGLHIQAAVGAGVLIVGQGRPSTPPLQTRAHTAAGPGVMVGIGYEWFVGREWSLGPAARLLWASTSGDSPKSSWEHTTWAPSLMLTASYH